jgi:hypothetical protein
MIEDTQILNEIRKEWETVNQSRGMVIENTGMAFFVSHGIISSEFGSIKLASSLLLLFAFSVLERVLLQFRSEGLFKCKSNHLGYLMEASRSVLPWCAYDLIDQAREKRNNIAHRREWIHPNESYQFIDAIGLELITWKIIE